MDAAVLMVAMPPAIEVRAVWVAVHVAPVAIATGRDMHLAVLVVAMPTAIEVPTVRVAVHVAMMVMMPVITRLDVDFLCLVHNPILGRG